MALETLVRLPSVVTVVVIAVVVVVSVVFIFFTFGFAKEEIHQLLPSPLGQRQEDEKTKKLKRRHAHKKS